MALFEGIIPAVTTPFNAEDQIDVPALKANVEAMLEAGVHGFVATGTMGEAGSLSTEERRLVVFQRGNARRDLELREVVLGGSQFFLPLFDQPDKELLTVHGTQYRQFLAYEARRKGLQRISGSLGGGVDVTDIQDVGLSHWFNIQFGIEGFDRAVSHCGW